MNVRYRVTFECSARGIYIEQGMLGQARSSVGVPELNLLSQLSLINRLLNVSTIAEQVAIQKYL